MFCEADLLERLLLQAETSLSASSTNRPTTRGRLKLGVDLGYQSPVEGMRPLVHRKK